ncbi:flagellar FlbD family protein [Blastococcus sp. PRF04-17]|uniref:flagellar FlbD family protein n=1 Tax=Blastococcus sp. PRF04-17 TaxID=2933797 RepID=UPI001FF47DF4|nr:flagellar FlbD family protein [Blastococcus sp. PRF04-17]UOY03589.1 flagellar FlbD family protein [Blastococcus sp. PRF04-17]
MIAVTCRNGEHFSLDPGTIARVETDPDTVVHLVDGTKYVVDLTFDQLLRVVSEHRATLLVAQKRLAGGVAEIAEHATHVRQSTMRVERRQYRRDGDEPHGSPADRAVPPHDAEA